MKRFFFCFQGVLRALANPLVQSNIVMQSPIVLVGRVEGGAHLFRRDIEFAIVIVQVYNVVRDMPCIARGSWSLSLSRVYGQHLVLRGIAPRRDNTSMQKVVFGALVLFRRCYDLLPRATVTQ